MNKWPDRLYDVKTFCSTAAIEFNTRNTLNNTVAHTLTYKYINNKAVPEESLYIILLFYLFHSLGMLTGIQGYERNP